MPNRVGSVERKTAETAITVRIDLDGTGQSRIQTPLPFLSHMLEQIARHGLFDLEVDASGDIEIDGHHTTEDSAIAIGQAFAKALGEARGIRRFGGYDGLSDLGDTWTWNGNEWTQASTSGPPTSTAPVSSLALRPRRRRPLIDGRPWLLFQTSTPTAIPVPASAAFPAAAPSGGDLQPPRFSSASPTSGEAVRR